MTTRWQCSWPSLRFLSMSNHKRLKLEISGRRKVPSLRGPENARRDQTEYFVRTWTLEVLHVALCGACLRDTRQRKVRQGLGGQGLEGGGTKHPSHRVQYSSLEVQRQDWEMRTPRNKDKHCSMSQVAAQA